MVKSMLNPSCDAAHIELNVVSGVESIAGLHLESELGSGAVPDAEPNLEPNPELLPESRPTLNPVLRDFWLAPARHKVLYGGRASSKSWDAAGFAVYLADNYRLRILCARQFQNKIEESVYALLKIQIVRFGLQHRFKILSNKIINTATGSEFLFYGLWRHSEEIKSLEGIDICWLEEAHGVTARQWEILAPTIRKAHSQFWIIFNPRLASDFVYRRFVLQPPPDSVVRKINYLENPFLSNTMLKMINAAKASDEAEYNHVYLGMPRVDDEASIIKRAWVMAAIDAHKVLGFGLEGEPAGVRRIGFDVADSGQDRCALVAVYGSVIVWAEEWQAREDELLKSCTRTYQEASARGASIIYDSIGVGAAAGAKFAELNAVQQQQMPYRLVSYARFNAASAVAKPDAKYGHTPTCNKDMFANLKAQTWWGLADRFRNTYNAITRGEPCLEAEMVSIDSRCPHLERLIDELCTPRRDYDPYGRVKVESKKDLARRDVPSPNLADACVMAFAPNVRGPLQISEGLLGRL